MVVWRRKNISQNRTDDTQISPVNVEEKTIDTGNDTLKSNTEEICDLLDALQTKQMSHRILYRNQTSSP